ncbi:unnamed protein product [Vitrella brassicaformis CCMP3155]|uniref:Cyclin-like domain-containing protein n=1 Tax=Vitrella brassicaformis (strain CCMP3155) TaxID=1169540 RepID=A0A0G4EIG0_VITBC|nr:unnamed protein product [Vitrella brassicaformis CCMP3155]|eukprot:CEL96180.1 unnamed protein product [Vitrella brassicaformis CCMP3155]
MGQYFSANTANNNQGGAAQRYQRPQAAPGGAATAMDTDYYARPPHHPPTSGQPPAASRYQSLRVTPCSRPTQQLQRQQQHQQHPNQASPTEMPPNKGLLMGDARFQKCLSGDSITSACSTHVPSSPSSSRSSSTGGTPAHFILSEMTGGHHGGIPGGHGQLNELSAAMQIEPTHQHPHQHSHQHHNQPARRSVTSPDGSTVPVGGDYHWGQLGHPSQQPSRDAAGDGMPSELRNTLLASAAQEMVDSGYFPGQDDVTDMASAFRRAPSRVASVPSDGGAGKTPVQTGAFYPYQSTRSTPTPSPPPLQDEHPPPCPPFVSPTPPPPAPSAAGVYSHTHTHRSDRRHSLASDYDVRAAHSSHQSHQSQYASVSVSSHHQQHQQQQMFLTPHVRLREAGLLQQQDPHHSLSRAGTFPPPCPPYSFDPRSQPGGEGSNDGFDVSMEERSRRGGLMMGGAFGGRGDQMRDSVMDRGGPPTTGPPCVSPSSPFPYILPTHPPGRGMHHGHGQQRRERDETCGPYRFEPHDQEKLAQLSHDDLIQAISCLLGAITSSDRQPGQVTKFDAVRVPGISVREYFIRLAEFFSCSPTCHLLSLIYIDRIVKCTPNFKVDALNIHRLLVTSTMLAAKFYDDKFLSNAYYAQVGGVSTKEINRLEQRFLALLDYRLVVVPHEFHQYSNYVISLAQVMRGG